MPGFNGSGVYQRFRSWEADAAAGIKIRADYHDDEDDGFAAGLSNTITRDGQSTITANIPFSGKKIINLGAPVDPTDAATKGYVDGVRNFASAISITGSTPESRLKYTGSTGPWGDSYVTADLAYGVRGTTWVWNTKADFSGTDVMVLAENGELNFATTIKLKIADKNVVQVAAPAGASGGGLNFIGNNMSLVPPTAPDSTQTYDQFNMYDAAGAMRTYLRSDFTASTAWLALHNASNVEVNRLTLTATAVVATKPIACAPASGNAQLELRGNTAAQVVGYNGNSMRWYMSMGDGSAEGGSNTGNNFILARCTDAGAAIGNVISFLRNTGECVIYSTVGSSSLLTGALSVRGGLGVAGALYTGSIEVVNSTAITRAGLRAGDNNGSTIWHSQPASVIVDYAGPASDYGMVFSNRNTGGGSSACLFLWVSGVSGSIVVSSGSTAYNTTSDIRTKVLVETPQDARALVDAIQVVEFTPAQPNEGDPSFAETFPVVEGVEPPANPTMMGIPAQQAYTVYPAAVTPPDIAMQGYDADAKFGDEGFRPWMVDYSKFVPMILANTQQNNRRLDALEARLATLEAA